MLIKIGCVCVYVHWITNGCATLELIKSYARIFTNCFVCMTKEWEEFQYSSHLKQILKCTFIAKKCMPFCSMFFFSIANEHEKKRDLVQFEICVCALHTMPLPNQHRFTFSGRIKIKWNKKAAVESENTRQRQVDCAAFIVIAFASMLLLQLPLLSPPSFFT